MISVIIPTLNEESTIEGMLSQFSDELIERHDIELILSDGGSTDGTLNLVKGRARIVLERPRDRKQTIGGGRNLGARHSSGDVLFFLNADVRVENLNRFITTMLEAVRPPNVVAATCPVYVYPEEETTLDMLYHRLHNCHVWFLNLLGLGTGRGECHVVKRQEFFLVGGYDEHLAAGEDFDLFMKLSRRGKIRFVRSLKVYESPRRYRRLGYGRVTFFWLLNALSILFIGKSFSKHWEAVR